MLKSSSQNKCRAKIACANHNLRAVPQNMHNHVTTDQRAVPQNNLWICKDNYMHIGKLIVDE